MSISFHSRSAFQALGRATVFLTACVGLGVTLAMIPGSAGAVPGFARQTGMACPACHTVYPELTPLGRRWKLNGFTWTSKEPAVSVTDDRSGTDDQGDVDVSIAQIPPLSLLFQAYYTDWNRPPLGTGPDGKTQNGPTYFPSQVSLLEAGRISDKFGGWVQLTYLQQTNSVGIDNMELRYADHTEDRGLVWGATANNNPTFQDVWNTGGSNSAGSTAFGIPYFPVGNILAFGTTKSPLILLEGTNSAGLGAYAFYKDSLYGELTFYRSAKPGVTFLDSSSTTLAPGGGTIDGLAPYWRIAYEANWGRNSLEVGAIGMFANFTPNVPAITSLSQAGRYTDVGVDSQYEWIGDDHIVTVEAMFLGEHSTNNTALVDALAASNGSDTLYRTSLTASYYYQRRWGGFINFTSINGRSDPLFYCAGTCDGSPRAQWESLELNYLPWLNTKLILQYNLYNHLGAASMPAFQGTAPPKASDANALVFAIWLAF